METKHICYAIKLADGGYATFFNVLDNNDVEILSLKNIANADYWNKEDAFKIFEDFIKNDNEDFKYVFTSTPLKVVRLTVIVEDEW